MHQTGSEVIRKIPIKRKGTKYVARARSNVKDSVPVVVAVRDMLGLARTSKEVQLMIHEKLLKINGRDVRNEREAIKLFSIFEADHKYVLEYNKHGKFAFDKTTKKERLCKVIGKKIVKGGQIQINMHDGTNIVSKDKIEIGDSVYVDFEGKMKSHVAFEKGKEFLVIEGKYLGKKGKIKKVDEEKIEAEIDGENKTLDKMEVAIL